MQRFFALKSNSFCYVHEFLCLRITVTWQITCNRLRFHVFFHSPRLTCRHPHVRYQDGGATWWTRNKEIDPHGLPVEFVSRSYRNLCCSTTCTDQIPVDLSEHVTHATISVTWPSSADTMQPSNHASINTLRSTWHLAAKTNKTLDWLQYKYFSALSQIAKLQKKYVLYSVS